MLRGATLWDLVERREAVTPDEVMAVDEHDRTMTFAQYRERAERAAAGLLRHGVEEGDVVSWLLPSWLESLVLVAALSRLGTVQNPMLPIYRQRELRFIARQTGARLIIVPSTWRGFDYEAMAREVARDEGGIEVLVCDRTLPDGEPSSLPALPPSPAGALPVRWLYYTSGTTADPKGARHTDATVMAAAANLMEAMAITADDVSPLVFPFTHIGGLILLLGTLMTGARLVVVEAFDPPTTIPLLARNDITLGGSGTPFHLAYLAAQRGRPDTPLFPLVRAFPGGASPKPPQLHHDLKRELGGVGIVSSYGLTECPIATSNRPFDPDDKLAHTEGVATTGVRLKVVTLDGRDAAPGEEGELRLHGPQLFLGYVDAALDAEALDEDGFLRTGDLARVDTEGFVTITGRLKDVIIRKGENISAKEIEDLLYQHPKVADVAVVGLPDPETGERACAVVAPVDPADPLRFDEMVGFLRDQQLMAQKIPERLETVDEVPRNPSGKILKHLLRDRYAAP